MIDRKPREIGWIWPVAAVAFAAGPLMAFLHETGTISIGPGATLWPVAAIALVAAAGAVAGIGIAVRVSPGLGAIVAVPNLIVVLFYGFLLLFFGLGGSR